ncbi:MAG: sulfur oxidation c-type cytochrome SoxA [Pseudomonadota bacterium]
MTLRNIVAIIWACVVSCLLGQVGADDNPASGPLADREQFRSFYAGKFPSIEMEAFVLGVYAIDPRLKSQWQALEEFPPYEFLLEDGEALWDEPLKDGSRYGDCFADHRPISSFPRFNAKLDEVITLIEALNACRRDAGEKAYEVDENKMKSLLAYAQSLARGQKLRVPDPLGDRERRAYEDGRRAFFTKRGQRNFACADCHMQSVGKNLREQKLVPLLGVVQRFPIYGLRWSAFGTLHQRFSGCFEMSYAKALESQSATYKNLEYFLAVMSKGLPIIGPTTGR